MARIETVAIVYQPPKVLLGMKRRGFAEGKYNGFGGGVQPGETPFQAAIRETQEEAHISLIEPSLLGKILFEFDSGEQDHLVYFFRATEYTGVPRESNEMVPEWFNTSEIPYDRMWADDKYWLPLLLEDKIFRGNFLFGANGQIVRHSLTEIVNPGLKKPK